MKVLMVFIGLSLLLSGTSHSSEEKFPAVFVKKPFESELSRKNLRKVLPPEKFSDLYLESLKYIESYGYSVEKIKPDQCPSKWVCGNDPSANYFLVKRVRDINLNKLVESINEVLRSKNSDSCSSFKVGNVQAFFNSESMIEYRAPVSFKKRWCWNDWAGDIASGSGTVSIRIVINQTYPTYQDVENVGTVKMYSAVNFLDLSATIFDFINYDDFLGRVIINVDNFFSPTLSLESIESGVNDVFKNINKSSAVDLIVDSGNAILSASRSLPKAIDYENQGVWISYLFPSETYFWCDDYGCMFRLTETKYIFERRINSEYNTYGCEIEYLKSLSKNTDEVIVKSGQTMWEISKEVYCEGEMYLYLLSQNPSIKNPNKLSVGQKLTVSPLYTYSLNLDAIVRPGDSLWSRWKIYTSTVGRYSWHDYKRNLSGGSDINVIYPLQLDNPADFKNDPVKK